MTQQSLALKTPVAASMSEAIYRQLVLRHAAKHQKSIASTAILKYAPGFNSPSGEMEQQSVLP
jgi:hypothetical protein